MADTAEWRKKYDTRIRSAQWRNMRRDIGRLRENKCERCGATDGLELHHKTYERLGRELTSDVELLCRRCHEGADKERAARGRAKSTAARYDAALDTYVTKVYGEDCLIDDAVAEEFNRWLEAKEHHD